MSIDHKYKYDSFHALDQASKSLEMFNQLIAMRRSAHYMRGETLTEWVFLGRFRLDSCGNVGKYIGENIPAIMFPQIPPVMTQDDFSKYVELSHKPEDDTSFWSSNADVPPAGIFCPICFSPWAITNCHDTVVQHKTEVVKLKEYVGYDLAYFQSILDRSCLDVRRLLSESNVRNDAYIDHTIVDSDFGRKYSLPINEKGWIKAPMQYIIKPGDEALINVWTYRHRECHRKQMAKKEKAYFKKIFIDAGYKNIRLIETQNQYCHGKFCCAPWYQVITDDIFFTIGWRKRVINITSNDYRLNFANLFSYEDVTKETHYIHAWGREKCIEYLQAIRELVIPQ